MPLGWYRSFLDAGPASHPRPMPVRRLSCSTRGQDHRTDLALSLDYLDSLAGPTRSVILPGCGPPFPREGPGFQLLLDEVATEVTVVLQETSGPG